jgi:hypothetical protein
MTSLEKKPNVQSFHMRFGDMKHICIHLYHIEPVYNTTYFINHKYWPKLKPKVVKLSYIGKFVLNIKIQQYILDS